MGYRYFTLTICSSPSRSAISALMGVQIRPLACVAMKLTASVVANWAAQIRSPLVLPVRVIDGQKEMAGAQFLQRLLDRAKL